MGLLDKVEKKDKEIQVKEDKDSFEEKNKIFTDMDRIYFEVNKSKNIKLKKLANSLGIPKDKIEEYAKLLNKEGMIKLHYPFFGSAKLGSIEEESESAIVKKSNKLIIFTIALVIIVALVILLLYQFGLILPKK